MLIEVFGTGSPEFNRAYDNVKKAAEEMGKAPALKKSTDVEEIAKRKIMVTPAVFVDGKIKFSGKVPTKEEAKEMLGG